MTILVNGKLMESIMENKELVFDRCTCSEYDYEEHTCPYAEDIYNEDELPYEERTKCNCCPYCETQCAHDI
jgi:hypothetical protein